MLTPLISNRASAFTPPSDDWYHLVPRGTFPMPSDHPLPALASALPAPASQILDDKALESICNRFANDALRQNFAGLLIDFDHFSYDPDKPSEAAGWLQELQNRSDGLWGRIKWSDKGEDSIRNGRYRFVSPTWLLRDCEVVPSPSATPPSALPTPPSPSATPHSPLSTLHLLRPLRLDSLALTNSPNLRGMAPLSNRGRDAGLSAGPSAHSENIHGGLIPGAPSVAKTTKTRMKTVATQLGLSPDASEEAIHSEVARLLQSVLPLRNRVAEVETAHAGLLAAQVESDLDLHQHRFPAAQRDNWKKFLLTNRAATLDLLSGLPETEPPAIPNRKPVIPPIHNRETALNPGERLDSAHRTPAPEITKTQAANIRNRAVLLRAADQKLTYDQSFQMAKNELAG